MIEIIYEFILIGVVGALLGIFYRNCLKVDGMIFNFANKWMHRIVEAELLDRIKSPKNRSFKLKVLSPIAYILGYCVYCNTTWITILLSIICVGGLTWQEMVLAFATSLGVQHFIVMIICKWVINNHPDLD